jgi:hypothetical protein
MVFVNGQKAELLVSATDGTEYEETGTSTVTFGASLLDADVVEFIIVGTYALQDGDLYYPKTEGLRKNLIINGDMAVSQRGTSFTGLTNGGSGYTLDRWRYTESGTTVGVFTLTQDTGNVGDIPFDNAMKIDCTTAEDLSDAAHFAVIIQRIEAQDLQHLLFGDGDAKSLTLSFYTKGNKAGVMSVSVYQPDGSRIYVHEASITGDSSWESIQFTIPGDSSGTINNDTGAGLVVSFCLSAGSTANDAGTDAWESFTDYASANQTNFLDNTANNLWLTGVQLEVGSDATPFEHRPYAEEFLLCARYFLQYNMGSSAYPFGIAHAANTTSLRCSMHLA